MMRRKKLALFSAYFPPSNLACVHRARLWARHLPEFGWDPIVVTTHWRHYREPPDWDLHALLSPELRVVHTGALPAVPGGGVNDVGIRGFAHHWVALRRLAEREKPDFLHITIPSNYSAMLGPLLWRSHRLPYGIDFQDPWVHEWPGSDRRFSKAWAARRLAGILEPRAVAQARLITGIAPGYLDGVLERQPALREQAVIATMPIGGSEADFDGFANADSRPLLFDPMDGDIHLVYAGVLLPQARRVLERLCEAVHALREHDSPLAARLKLHFIGTGGEVRSVVQRQGVAGTVLEHPQRIGYGEVLRHLQAAAGSLIVGSTEPHYSPSKLYQAVHGGRPVFALLHEASSALTALRESNAGVAVALGGGQLPDVNSLAAALAGFLRDLSTPRALNRRAFEAYSARNSARQLAAALDAALERVNR